MSRPTRDKSYIDSAYSNYGPSGVIDFAHPQLACAYEPSIYAQAGFPGYPQPLGYQYAPCPPYPPTHLAQPYAAPVVKEEPLDTGELHERINAKIDSIISSQRASAHEHKAEILGAQIERLNRTVQKLSDSMEKRRGDDFCHALAAETKAESDDEEPLRRDDDIASRLRRMASKRRGADW